MSGDSPRLIELRRRVQADPASMAFAQLAEECRRAGENHEAIGICRAGLAYHPDYLSARVTLGRALAELRHLDEARAELQIVLASAPDNLAANRAMAEVYQQRGEMQEALTYYKKALQLAQVNPNLEHAVERIQQSVSPPPPPIPVDAAPVRVEDLFDFDTLLEQLGGRTQPKPEIPKPELTAFAPSPFEAVVLPADDADPFAQLERQLREIEQAPIEQASIDQAPREHAPIEEETIEDPAVVEARRRDQRVIGELEGWLMAIVTDRENQAST